LELSDSEQLEYVSKPKSVICQEIGVDVLIDDCLEHVFDCSSLGIDVLLYDRQGKYKWNHEIIQQEETKAYTSTSTSKRLYQQKPILKNVHRMLTWRDIIAQFPKPSSPLRYCSFNYEYDEEEEDDSIEDQDEEDDYQPVNYYNGYETVEVEEMSEEEEEEEYPLWRQNEVWA
jgi:hypothetical protein